jgi:hypothetical protein
MTAETQAWYNIKHRCTNPKDPKWKYYGGRGIELRFPSFKEFIAEIGLRPSPQHSVDRINNNGHYEPGNVRWAAKVEQARHRKAGAERLSNAERQARWRAKRDAEAAALKAEVAALKTKLAKLTKRKPAAKRARTSSHASVT